MAESNEVLLQGQAEMVLGSNMSELPEQSARMAGRWLKPGQTDR